MFDYIKPQSPMITISCKIFLHNFESLGVSVEGSSVEECKNIITDALNSMAKNSEVTREQIENYKRRVLE